MYDGCTRNAYHLYMFRYDKARFAGLPRAAFLKALAPVFPGVAFCPTGGIDEGNAGGYLSLPNVPVVGGSWMAPREFP